MIINCILTFFLLIVCANETISFKKMKVLKIESNKFFFSFKPGVKVKVKLYAKYLKLLLKDEIEKNTQKCEEVLHFRSIKEKKRGKYFIMVLRISISAPGKKKKKKLTKAFNSCVRSVVEKMVMLEEERNKFLSVVDSKAKEIRLFRVKEKVKKRKLQTVATWENLLPSPIKFVMSLSSITGTAVLPDWTDSAMDHIFNGKKFETVPVVFQDPPSGTLINSIGITNMIFVARSNTLIQEQVVEIETIDMTPPNVTIEGIQSGDAFLNDIPDISVEVVDNYDPNPIVALHVDSQPYHKNITLKPGLHVLRAKGTDSSKNTGYAIDVLFETLSRPRYIMENIAIFNFTCEAMPGDVLDIKVHLDLLMEANFDVMSLDIVNLWLLDQEAYVTLNDHMIFTASSLKLTNEAIRLEFVTTLNQTIGCPHNLELTGAGSEENGNRFDIHAIVKVPSTRRRTFSSGTGPTSAPNESPTNSPSNETSSFVISAPSESPTTSLSDKPSSYKTSVPSESDATSSSTQGPSSAPNESPTTSPSNEPSSFTSSAPSESDATSSSTQGPSSAPNESPTNIPSDKASGFTSSAPSETPTTSPSNKPSSFTSSAPSKSDATSSSTQGPSSAPNESPTTSPSNKPSSFTSSAPSESPMPSLSDMPSSYMTSAPSESNAPSPMPTLQHISFSPTVATSPVMTSPSTEPFSSSPTTAIITSSTNPTTFPELPTKCPTCLSTQAPSSAPSKYPTKSLSDKPSSKPSATPSFAPTASCVCEWKSTPFRAKNGVVKIGPSYSSYASEANSIVYSYGGYIWGKGYASDFATFNDMTSSVQTPRSDAKVTYYLEGPEGKCFADWKCRFRPQFSVHVFTNPPASAEAKGRMGIRAEAWTDFCGKTIARGGLKKEDTESWKIKATIAAGKKKVEGNLAISVEVINGGLKDIVELIDPSAGAGEGFVNDGDVKNKNGVDVTFSGDVEISVAADGWRTGVFIWNTGISKAEVNDSLYGMKVTGSCTEDTMKRCTCQDSKGIEEVVHLFSLN